MFDKIYKHNCCDMCREALFLETMPCDFTCCHRLVHKQTGIAEEIQKRQSYERGVFDGRNQERDDIRYTRFMSLSDQEKFLKRFNECMKPIEQLRKDLESGKF
jgi:hypothetical protein